MHLLRAIDFLNTCWKRCSDHIYVLCGSNGVVTLSLGWLTSAPAAIKSGHNSVWFPKAHHINAVSPFWNTSTSEMMWRMLFGLLVKAPCLGGEWTPPFQAIENTIFHALLSQLSSTKYYVFSGQLYESIYFWYDDMKCSNLVYCFGVSASIKQQLTDEDMSIFSSPHQSGVSKLIYIYTYV
jgi:hypothetical protein